MIAEVSTYRAWLESEPNRVAVYELHGAVDAAESHALWRYGDLVDYPEEVRVVVQQEGHPERLFSVSFEVVTSAREVPREVYAPTPDGCGRRHFVAEVPIVLGVRSGSETSTLRRFLNFLLSRRRREVASRRVSS